ncbi:hypothetical protein TCAL_00673 [Tigriopus californicus]|uniref:SET domain-containing protein n=1 Tax=Tigriopus californicus TaxID=6832 RepID=A0A553PDY2_TIGCA|nr:uncharacterized protein LOC131893212 [Tigriopus californicus]TRY75896.1 hypothetical protein TCAL_00673 [Tigriopus californicus]|eukprot:TCALIF_00673-PA protein Name:"Similar to set5 SET domain-containing protein 5 (Schizosaccharomyces pombe (strain 972 / ATCC 24843))" AED:0.00 eAED:0.00 QI:346/1/1/1/0.5/1/3/40/383
MASQDEKPSIQSRHKVPPSKSGATAMERNDPLKVMKIGSRQKFVIKDMENKGKGAVAVKDIEEGELILAESPLFIVPWWVRTSPYPGKEVNDYILDRLSLLSEKEQASFYALSDCKCSVDEEKSEMGIWRTNNFALGRSSKKCDNAIFIAISRFNHSCVPLAEFHWNTDLKRQEIRAIVPIQGGQEITLCYVTSEVLTKSKSERQKRFWEHYGFECACPDCQLQGPRSLDNDAMRERVAQLERKIIDLIYVEVKTEPSEGDSGDPNNGDFEPEQRLSRSSSRVAEDFEEALKHATERFRLMKRLGFKAVSLLDACSMIVDIAYDVPDYRTAKMFCKEGLRLSKMLYGWISSQYKDWEERLSLVQEYQNLSKTISSYHQNKASG